MIFIIQAETFESKSGQTHVHSPLGIWQRPKMRLVLPQIAVKSLNPPTGSCLNCRHAAFQEQKRKSLDLVFSPSDAHEAFSPKWWTMKRQTPEESPCGLILGPAGLSPCSFEWRAVFSEIKIHPFTPQEGEIGEARSLLSPLAPIL